MNGIHDMGGMHGMGPIEVREDERPFHAEWEARAWGLHPRHRDPLARPAVETSATNMKSCRQPSTCRCSTTSDSSRCSWIA